MFRVANLILRMKFSGEEAFFEYWKNNREVLSTTGSKVMRGLPVAILFVLPILASLLAVYFFSPEWYTKVAPKHAGTFTTIFIALFICALFMSYFRMHLKWEENEEAYQQMKSRKERHAAKINPQQSS